MLCVVLLLCSMFVYIYSAIVDYFYVYDLLVYMYIFIVDIWDVRILQVVFDVLYFAYRNDLCICLYFSYIC